VRSGVTDLNYLNLQDLSELENDFLYKFRHSKCLDTLDKQCERLEIKHKDSTKHLSAINYAWCIRERELENVNAPTFKIAGMKNTLQR
jgi:hypothetical protein